MSNIYNWNNQLDAINRVANTWGSITDQMEVTSNIKNMSSTLELVSDQIKTLNVANSFSNTWSEHFSAYNAIRDIDFSSLLSVQDSVQQIMKKLDFSAFTNVLENFKKLDCSDAFTNISSALQVYDSIKFSNSVQNVFNRLEWKNSIQVSEIVEEVTEQYIEDNEIDETASEEIREVVAAKDKRLFTDKQRKIWEVYVYPFLVSLLFFILSSRQLPPVTVNNVTEVSNHYTVETGLDVAALNNYNFRIVCKENVMPRKKPDRSSKVIGHLPMGKIVCIVDKYKKWFEIMWENDEGEYCSGWVQNYRVTTFK